MQSRRLLGSQAKGTASPLHQLCRDMITRAVRGCKAIPHLGCNPRGWPPHCIGFARHHMHYLAGETLECHFQESSPAAAVLRSIICHSGLLLDLLMSMMDRDVRPTWFLARFNLMLEYARKAYADQRHSNSLTVRCGVGPAARVKVHSASSLRLEARERDGPRGRWQWNTCKSRLDQHHPFHIDRALPQATPTHLTTPQEYRARVVQHIPSELGRSGNLTTPQYPPNQPSSNLTHTARSDTSEDLKTRTSILTPNGV